MYVPEAGNGEGERETGDIAGRNQALVKGLVPVMTET